MKKLVALLLAAMLAAALPSAAFAADPPSTYSSVPTEGTPAKGNVGSAEGHLTRSAAIAAGEYGDIKIISWRNSIQEISPGYLQLYGMTMTDLWADRVDINFYLQQWNGTEWVTYSTSLNNRLNTDYFSLNIYRYVAHGYYYRLKTVHRAFIGIAADTKTLYSSYIYVP